MPMDYSARSERSQSKSTINKMKVNPKAYFLYGLAACFLLQASLICIRQTIAIHQAPQPQAALMLGGGSNREIFTAEFAKQHPHLDIWVSSGSPKKRSIFQTAGIPSNQIHFDDRATDTVTNFTTLIPEFKKHSIQHIYLITSDFHMPRAQAIAFLVLGSQGITFTPVVIPSDRSPESPLHILRDISRAYLWVTTGRTGASLRSQFS